MALKRSELSRHAESISVDDESASEPTLAALKVINLKTAKDSA